MIDVTDLKNGTTFLFEEKPYRVVKYTFTKMGRGGANVRLSVRNLETGGVEQMSFGSNVRVEAISTNKRVLQYLYKQSLRPDGQKDSGSATFMDPKTFEQIEIPLLILGDSLLYIKEGWSVSILFWNSQGVENPLDVELPAKIVLKVIETDPGVRGNSATNIYKPAKLENGLSLKVPLFIKTGDTIVIDTRKGEYVERAKE